MLTAFALALAMIIDALFGEPNWLWSRVPHPAVLMGRLIGWADKRFNRGASRKAKGIMLVSALVVGTGCLGLVLRQIPLLEVFLGAILLAQKSLIEHVRAVARALETSVKDGRKAVSMIVGRDTAELDAHAVGRGAIESAAENFSDGVIAPAFWFLILGLPGILIYKIVNTADSMIGYRTERHEDFGWAAARFDDLLNLIPARLTAVLLFPWGKPPSLWKDIYREAKRHRSPNAGWPEASLSRSLGVALSGPRAYHGEMQPYPWVNPDGRPDVTPRDIDAACARLWAAWAFVLVCVTILSFA
ncbi:adenosylcobinamide-phosphate synthase CbiB [Celeribacter litoreus]|uniref:adenosylcobinamide-phosphate synthase CbiB n=1 Tax=Celeribacter litoreus TaxID=2876714 RepID=UPI001CCDAE3F|nr:adenosylcobinamide-phosphate synthase CbiB [Celeribacter litoreus]MCA0042334.1 adenosylcobinamide-phosphate synthase CbiB [Celeribacter litoreus]